MDPCLGVERNQKGKSKTNRKPHAGPVFGFSTYFLGTSDRLCVFINVISLSGRLKGNSPSCRLYIHRNSQMMPPPLLFCAHTFGKVILVASKQDALFVGRVAQKATR